MLSEEDKKDILADAHNPLRKQAFDESRQRAIKKMSWEEYFAFLKSTQNFFGLSAKPHKILGDNFKL